MEEKYKRGFENAGKFITFIMELIFVTGGLIYNLLLVFGAFASLFLVFKLFPMDFVNGLVLFYPIWNAVWNILFFWFWILFGSLAGYGVVRFGFFLYDVRQRDKERAKKKRDKFLDDLADKMNKKLKVKRK